jgi:hypothetical protein
VVTTTTVKKHGGEPHGRAEQQRHNVTFQNSSNIDPGGVVNHDLSQAERYIEALTGKKDTPVTFQTFPEGGPSDPGARILHGTLDEHYATLVTLNRAGHGIFVTVNEGDGHGRCSENIVALRALFTDDDGDGPTPKPSTEAAPPTLVVESAHGAHTYWALQSGEPLSAFEPAQAALAAHFGTDPKVKDLPRVMRVPGFFHLKDRAHPFLVTMKDVRPVSYSIKQVLAAFPSGVEAANQPATTGAKGASASRSRPTDANIAVRRARAYLAKVPGAVQGKHGDDTTYQVACVLVRDFALAFEDALALLRDWNQTCTPPWSDADLIEKLKRAEKYAAGEVGSKLDADPAHYAATEEVCFVVPLMRYFARDTRGQWRMTSPLTEMAVRKHLRSLGMPEKNISNVLALDLMPLADDIDCAPGLGAVFDRDGRFVINTYKPSRILPTPGDWPHIRSIMEAVTDSDPAAFAWLLNWMAAKYQNPGARSMTAVVFQGQQGKGKTVLGLVLAVLLGEENTACISQADLESSFNGHYVTKLFVIADEVVNPENLKDTASILKKYVTDPRIIGNVKNTPQFEVQNRMSWWFTSNSITPVKVEGPNDRRYTVFSALTPTSDEHKAMCRSVFRPDGSFTPEFEREMAAFADALATHQVDHALATQPLKNQARETLINAGRSSAELFLAEVEERGVEAVVKAYYATSQLTPLPRWDFGADGFAVDAVYGAFRRYCEANGMSACKRERLGQEMRLFFPHVERTRASDEGKRVKVYRGLPTQGRSES